MIIEVSRRDTGPVSHLGGTVTDGAGNDTFHVKFDPEDDSVIDVIVTAVSSIHNEPSDQLEPLARHVDPALLANLTDPDARCEFLDGVVSFRYEGLKVTVQAGGDIYLEWI